MTDSNYKMRGIVYAVAGTLLFSLKSIFIKLLYVEGLDADSVLVFRMAIALPIYALMLLYCVQRVFKREPDKQVFTLQKSVMTLIAGALGYYFASLLDLMGLELITAQLERLALFSYPLFVALIGIFAFKAPFTKRLFVGFAMSYVGIGLVVYQEGLLLGNEVGLGVSFVLLSALVFAVYLVMSKSLIAHFGSLLFTSLAMTVSSVMVFFHGYLSLNIEAVIVSNTAWFWLFMLAIVSTVIPSFMISEAIGRIGPSRASAIGMLGPVFTIILAVIFLNEPFTWLIGLGAMLVLMGVGSIQLKR